MNYIDEALERLLHGQNSCVEGAGHEDPVFSSIVGKLEKLADGISKIDNLVERLDYGELAANLPPAPIDNQYPRWNSMLLRVEKRVGELEGSLIIDEMTGMPNRQIGLRVIEQRLRDSLPSDEHCLAFIDLDDLKRINDSFGHGAGDMFIQSVAGVILSSIRCSDVAARYGGDEFVVFFGGCGRKMASRKLREMCAALNKVNLSEEFPYRMSFSYGIASNMSDGTDDLWDLINLADRRMYINKQRHIKPEPLLGRERRLKFKVCARLK